MWLRGVRRGDRVGLFAGNSPDWVLVALSVFRLGAVLVPLDPVWDPEQVAKLASQFDTKLLIAGSRQYLRLAERLPASRLVLIDEHCWLRAPEGAQDAQVPHLHPTPACDAAVLAFTAGVANRSKSVVLTHENLTSAILACAKVLPFDYADKIVSTLPLSNVVGFTVGLAVPFLNGSTMVFSDADSAAEIKNVMGTAGPTVLIGHPPLLQSMLVELENEVARLSRAARLALGAFSQLAMAVKHATVYSHEHRSMAGLAGKVVSAESRFSPQLAAVRRFCFVASRLSGLPAHLNRGLLDSLESFGAPIKCWISCDQPASPELVAAIESFGIPFLNVYAITEASGPVAVRQPFEPWYDAFPQQLEGIEIKIESTTFGDTGEILIRSPRVAQCYYTTDGSTCPVTLDGWLHTGDIGLLDEQEGLFLCGNQAELILTNSGMQLDPLRLEQALSACPAVCEVCVFARAGKSGRELCAAVVSSPLLRSVADRRELIARELAEALESLPESERLAEFQVWDEPLPRTGCGKLRRGEIAALYASKRKAKEPKTPAKTALVWNDDDLVVLKAIGEVMDPEVLRGISPSGSRMFAPRFRLTCDLGLDSLARLELSIRLSQHFQVAISEQSVNESRTVEDLVLLVRRLACMGGGKPEAPRSLVDLWSETAWPARHEGAVPGREREDTLLVAGRRTAAVAVRTYARIFHNLETAGADRLMMDPPYIVAANHISRLDALALMSCFPVNLLRFVRPVIAAEELGSEGSFAAIACCMLNAVAYDRTDNLGDILNKLEGLLQENKVLLVFPEGLACGGTELRRFKGPAARLAMSVGCPVIPAFIEGTDSVLPERSSSLRSGDIKVTFGLPIYPPPPDGRFQSYLDLAARLEQAVASLSPAMSTTRASTR